MCEIPSTDSSTVLWWDFLFVHRAERPAHKVVVNLSFNHPKKGLKKNKNKVYHWENIKKNLEMQAK